MPKACSAHMGYLTNQERGFLRLTNQKEVVLGLTNQKEVFLG
jgi:hypothetical protein